MEMLNFHDLFGSNLPTSGGPSSGELLRVLQRLARKQSLLQRLASKEQPSESSPENSRASGGLDGRMIALEGGRQQSPTSDGDRWQAPSSSPGPNFRQLVRVSSTVGPRGAVGVSARSGDQSNPYSNANDVPLDNVSASGPGYEEPSPYGNRPVPVLAGFRSIGRGGVSFSPGPVKIPEFPMPQMPDTWRRAWTLMQILPRLSSGMWGGGGDLQRCVKASGGSTEDWEEFCRNLGAGQNNVSGGETAKRACWSKTHESSDNKRNWCGNQFGAD